MQQHPTTNGGPGAIPSAFINPPAVSDQAKPETEIQRPATPPADFSFAREESQDGAAAPPPVRQVPEIVEPAVRAPSPPPPPMPVPVPAPAPVVQETHSFEPPKSAFTSRFPEPVHEPAPAPVLAPAPVPAPEPVIITKENPVNQQLLSENKVLKSEIERLKNELAVQFTQPPPVSELRRRRNSDASDATDMQTVVEESSSAHIQPDGVPLNIVVAISFTVFFMTYLFF